MRAVSQEIPQPLTTKISLKITHLKFTLNLPWANELIVDLLWSVTSDQRASLSVMTSFLPDRWLTPWGLVTECFILLGNHWPRLVALCLPSIIQYLNQSFITNSKILIERNKNYWNCIQHCDHFVKGSINSSSADGLATYAKPMFVMSP